MKKDLLSIQDLTSEEVHKIFTLAAMIKKTLKKREYHKPLKEMTMAMIFEKPSLRTRLTFETGMFQMGGHAIYLTKNDINMGERESIHDIAKNLERWVEVIIARVYDHKSVAELARHCTIPVINALSDKEHPCQAITDLFTLKEKWGDLKGKTLTFIGDGNNTCHSLILLGTMMGMNIIVSGPEQYKPEDEIEKAARDNASQSGGSYSFEPDPVSAVKNSDAIYTDVWASMGQEEEAEQRAKDFASYQVNAQLLASAPESVLIMHDLPAHRGEEITDEVIDCEQSIVFDQAENRLHAQKGIVVYLVNWFQSQKQ